MTIDYDGSAFYLDRRLGEMTALANTTRDVLKHREELLAENERLREMLGFGEFSGDEWHYTDPALVAGMAGLAERHGAQKIVRIAVYIATHPAPESAAEEKQP